MLKNLTIKSRLLAVLALLSLTLLGIGGAGMAGLGLGNETRERAYHDRLVALGRLDGILQAMQRNQLVMAQATSGDPSRLPATIRTVARDRALAGQLWADYSASRMTEHGQALAARFSSARSSYLAEGLDPALTAAAAANVPRMKELLHGSMAETFAEVTRTLDALLLMQRTAAQLEYAQSQARAASLHSVLLALLAGGLALAAGLGAWLVRSITIPLNRAVRIAESVAAGNLGQRIEATSGDETGRLLAALQELNRKLATAIGNVRSATGAMASASARAGQDAILAAAMQEQAASLTRAVDGFRLEQLAPGEEGYEAPVISLAARAREERARHARAFSRTA